MGCVWRSERSTVLGKLKRRRCLGPNPIGSENRVWRQIGQDEPNREGVPAIWHQ
jgi:hypothetical protein